MNTEQYTQYCIYFIGNGYRIIKERLWATKTQAQALTEQFNKEDDFKHYYTVPREFYDLLSL